MAEKLTVLHIITGLEDAGAEGALYRLVTQDKAVTHIVVSLAGPGKYGPMLEDAGIRLHCLNTTPKSLHKSLHSLIKMIREEQPDAVQTWMYEADVFGGLAARLAGVRNIHWSIRFSTVDMKGVPSKMKWAIRASIPLARLLPKTIISCANKAVDEHVKLGYPRHLWRVVHNGYNFDTMTFSEEGRARIRTEFGIPAGAKVIGMVARFDPQKDHESLMKALGSLRDRQDFHVLLVGRGVDTDPEMDALVNASGLGDRVHQTGSRQDVRDLFSAMDIHVLASRFGEGFPNVVAESMACGAWSISTDSGDATYILEDKGFLVPMQNTWSLTRAIDAQLSLIPRTKAARVQARENNRAHVVERFSLERMISGFHDIWFEPKA